MIARIWRGYAKPEHADSYESMLKPELLPGISQKIGYRGSLLMRRVIGEEIEFTTIIFWNSLDELKMVTGPDYETAIVPAERRKFLVRFDSQSTHCDIVAEHGLTKPPA